MALLTRLLSRMPMASTQVMAAMMKVPGTFIAMRWPKSSGSSPSRSGYEMATLR